jgi:hypothetical protein
VYFVPLAAVAWIVQLLPTTAVAAVNSPPALIDPHFVAAHMTCTFAVNNCVLFCGVFGATGEIVIGETTFTLADALPLPLVAFAVMVHALG